MLMTPERRSHFEVAAHAAYMDRVREDFDAWYAAEMAGEDTDEDDTGTES